MSVLDVVSTLAASPPAAAARRGVVTGYDERVGLGTVTLAVSGRDAGGEVPFHCTAIADGTRSIPSGAEVVCTLRSGHHGCVEATGVLVVP